MTPNSWRQRWLDSLSNLLWGERETRRQASPRGRIVPRLEELERRLAPATTFSIADNSVIEPAPGGTVDLDFTVTRTGDLTSQVTVGYTTVAGTAQPTTDFTPETGTTTFAYGSATATIGIPVFGNGVYDNPSLTFSVQLTGITNVVGPPVTLAAHTDFTTGTNPFSVAIGDLNGDGKPDLVVANNGAATVSVLLNTTAPGASTPTFAPKVDFATGSFPISVAIGDVNGDGLPDLIVANHGSNTVSVLLNTTAPGATTPTFDPKVDFGTGTGPRSVALVDVNGDGKPDIVVANDGSASVSVLMNTTAPGASTPSFPLSVEFTTGTEPISVAIGDLNGDGKPDLVVANYTSNTVSVLMNTTAPGASTPTFATQQTFATGTHPISVAVGDLNGDGLPDLAVANHNSSPYSVSVLLNTTAPGATTPSFAPKVDFATGFFPFSVAIGDINGDGKRDLVVANHGGASNSVSVLLNMTAPGATTPTFATQQTFAVGMFPASVAIGDLNGDGQPDLVVANYGSNSVSVLLNTTVLGAATIVPAFPQAATPAVASKSFSVVVGDVNGDGKPDLVVANYGANTISVLLNTTAPGASTSTFGPKVDFPTGSGPFSVTIGDLNGDGKPDILVANRKSATVSVLLNTTAPGAKTPNFTPAVNFTTGAIPTSVVIGDINGDGKPDIVVANYGFDSLSVLLNTTTAGASTPTFAPKVDFTTGTNPFSVALGDVNGDGKPDLVVANAVSDTVSVLLNTTTTGASTPTFAPKVDFPTGSGPKSVALGDLNGDGKPDIVVANLLSGTVSVLLNTTTTGASTPTFAPKVDFTTGFAPYSVVVADINGDGKPDLVVANYDSDTVSVLLNTTVPSATTPSFAPKVDFTTGSDPNSDPDHVAIADLNGDGRPDLVVANANSTTVSVLLNTPEAITNAMATGTITESDPPSITAEFSGAGVWRYDVGPGWRQISPANASLLAMDAAGDAVAEFPGSGVWRYSGGVWTPLTTANASLLAMGANGDVAAEFPGAGVWRYRGGVWTQLTTANASLLAMDAVGDVAADLAGDGVWRYTATSWKQLTTANASVLAMDAAGDLAADLANDGVWRYSGGVWTQLTTANASVLAMDAAGDVAADLANDGVWRYTSGWTQLTTANASVLAMDLDGDVVADLANDGVWRYLGGVWKQLDTSNASLLATIPF